MKTTLNRDPHAESESRDEAAVVTVTVPLPPSLWEEVERLVPEDERTAFFLEAVRRELLYRENAE